MSNVPTATPDPLVRPLALELHCDPVISWAAEHCGVPLIRGLTLRNEGPGPLGDLTLECALAPDFIEPSVTPIAPIQEGESREIIRQNFRLPAGRLRQITELEHAEWHVTVRQGGEVLAELRQDVEVLPCNHYPGSRQPAGLLTAFITPNHPVVAQLLKRAADGLRELDGSASLTGYQERNPQKVKAQVVALIQVIQRLGLSYLGMPASFETTGQKVRFPDVILRDQMANCLDLTLLVSACLEQMGLRPLVVLVQGHAFPGVWLVEDRFPEGQVLDAARLRTLLALDQIAVWDSSAILQQPPLSFGQLQEIGQRHLASDDTFEFALDVRVLRGERFLPLPLRESVEAAPAAEHGEGPTRSAGDELREILEAATREGNRLPVETIVRPPQVITRWQRWKDRLLDLSLRNRLLNFKPAGSSALALEVPDLGRFEDLLAAQTVFDVLPRPPQDARDARDLKLLALREDAATWKAQRLADLESRTLHSPLTPGDFWTRARDLDLKAKNDLEEGGVCTLFASLGLLRWFEPGVPTERFAPLLLYPVQLLFNRQLRRITLQRLPEDPVANTTLIEKLRRDHGVDLAFLADLDADASGLDMGQMLRQSREAIARMPRWEVLDEVHLGHFTFAKFLMWKDLEDNAEVLLHNPVIHHLAMEASGDLAHQPEAVSVAALESMPPGQFPCVVDADSTQLSAVASALAGRSFVLQGPPGTGKSQTIANLIACALAQHRRVLFVSEKMAALEVVHARLKQAGLEDFCLELHSHKANRRAVVESIQRAVERATRVNLQDWENREADLAHHRDVLNTYHSALHQPRALGLSLHDALARAHALRHAPQIHVHREGLDTLTAEDLRSYLRAVEDFAQRAETLEGVNATPWTHTLPGPWSHALEESLQTALQRTRAALADMIREIAHLNEVLGVSLPQTVEVLKELVATLPLLPELPEAALEDSSWAPLAEALVRHHQARQALTLRESALDRTWTPALLEQDLAPLQSVYQQHALTFPLIRWIFLWGAQGRLKAFARGTLPAPLDVVAALTEAMDVQRERRRLSEEGARLIRQMAPTPWDKASELPDRVQQIRRIQNLLVRTGCTEHALSLAKALPPERLHSAAEALGHALQTFLSKRGELFHLLGWSSEHRLEGEAELPFLSSALEAWEGALPAFRPWCHYLESAAALDALGHSELPEAHRAGTPAAALLATGERALLERWAVQVRDQEPALRAFDGTQHHHRVGRFRELDRHWIQLGRQFVLQRLEARLPQAAAGVSENSEMGILLREIKKKARHLPVRKLLQAIPTLLPRLKPCLLMSPLSVAQYLPAEGEPFDLLIFDEASQITTHDAIGALARGRQVVVVGDSRQLPPTSFFSRNLDEEGTPDENDVTELESILDEAVAKQFPQQLLGWHYRSRHHDLIDFSNRHYYEGRLHVFPAAVLKTPDLGLAWHPVPDGVYFGTGCEPRKLERTNPREAETLVSHLTEALRTTPVGARSFGVVTFSMSQQRLVQELLDEQRALHPEIEGHFQGLESVFVKNLENVQGDERDEILFSIGYARDAKGRLRMAFGPLSVTGGERRLNVAVTRARCQLRVFSTLTFDQIDLGRTTSRGAEHLRAFLQFVASKGTAHMSAPIHGGLDPLEQDIAETLEAMGHQVHAQIGCGGYRIDLAVLDPTRTGHYLLGIECDGASYRSAPSARDRDRLRHQVLEGLGWRLHRIWSADWLEFREREIQRLNAAIAEAGKSLAGAPPPSAAAEAPLEPAYQSSSPLATAAEAPHAYAATPIDSPGLPYIEASLPSVPRATPEDFYLPSSTALTSTMVQQILAEEAPIHRDDLDGRIVRAWGWSALTKRGRGHLDGILQRLTRAGDLQIRDAIVWRTDQDPATYTTFRLPPASGLREAERIAPEEIANAMAAVLTANIALDESSLLRETARLLGFRRVTPRTTEALRSGLRPLLDQHDVRNDAGVYKPR